MSSAECFEKANKFKELESKLAGLHEQIDSCVSAIANNEAAMDSTIISGMPLDEGQLVEAKEKISSINNDITTMQDECDDKYEYWYNEGVAKKAEEDNNDWWPFW